MKADVIQFPLKPDSVVAEEATLDKVSALGDSSLRTAKELLTNFRRTAKCELLDIVRQYESIAAKLAAVSSGLEVGPLKDSIDADRAKLELKLTVARAQAERLFPEPASTPR